MYTMSNFYNVYNQYVIIYTYIIIYNIFLIDYSPNCSFFMAATYFSSSERRLDRGFGLAAVFLEHSANFRSVDEEKTDLLIRFIFEGQIYKQKKANGIQH